MLSSMFANGDASHHMTSAFMGFVTAVELERTTPHDDQTEWAAMPDPTPICVQMQFAGLNCTVSISCLIQNQAER